jgi:hypothetical protein
MNRPLLGALAVLAALAARPTKAADPIFCGETLKYEMSWGPFNGGTMTIATSPRITFEGRDAYRIELEAISNDFISTFFVVRDSIRSWIDAETLQSIRYEKHTVEGKHVRDERIDFDFSARIARQGRKEVPFDPPIFDSLSAIYYVRNHELIADRPLEIAVVSGSRAYRLVIDVLGEETVKTPEGVFLARVVHPKMKEEGLLKKGGDLWLWLTQDSRHVPVMIRSKLNFGTLTAKIKSGAVAPPSSAR